MLLYDEIDDSEDDFFYEEDESNTYPEIREVLASEYQYLSPDDIELLFDSIGISAEDMEFSLGKAFKSVGHFAKKVAPTALPILGTAVGTVVGGPAGAALGGMLGRAAGGLVGQAGARRRPVRPSTARSIKAQPRLPSGAGSPAAAQLLQMLSRPEVLQGLTSMALGRAGQQNVRVGNTQIPTGAIGNLLSVLANQASSEYNASTSYEGATVPGYLLDTDGEFLVDPAIPEDRAALLVQLLDNAAWERAFLNRAEEDLIYETEDYELDLFEDDYYDQLDLIDLYSAEDWED
ncbi:MAG: hypothetical protein H6657_15005 [Ardenticatenaceae bacterium]|nr:hypothetical protein [Ardenticatenaceae bacterium]